jgi:hypothetical protein
MARKKEDEFLERVKVDLAKRVNYHCSICDAQTSGPKAGTDKAFSIGKAAHITAAASNGPRYDATMTSEERSSFSNGIWCCSTCSEIIDHDAKRYPVEELHRLKTAAEERATGRIGRTPASGPPVPRTWSEIDRAVQMLCLNEAARHEALDPRFSVDVKYKDGNPVYVLTARETVNTTLHVQNDDLETIESLGDVLAYGGTRSFNGEDIVWKGSPLFHLDANGPSTRIQITTAASPVVVTVAFGEGDRCVIVDFTGERTAGQKGVRILGTALGGLLGVEITYDWQTDVRTFKLKFELQQWAGKAVLGVPNFQKLEQLAKTLNEGTPVRLSLVSDGNETELGGGALNAEEYHSYLKAFLKEMTFLRKVARFFNLNVAVPADIHDVLSKACRDKEKLAFIDLPTMKQHEMRGMFVPEAPIEQFLSAVSGGVPERTHMKRMVEPFVLLDATYGPFEVEVECEKATFAPVGPAQIEVGVPIAMGWRPAEGYCWSVRSNGPC